MQTMLFSRGHVYTLLVVGLASIASCALPLAARADDSRSLPLVNQRGETFRLANLRGRPALVTFVATRCTDACPLANAAFQSLSRRLRRERLRARLVTISLDPEYDTPFVMAHVAQSFAAAPEQWILASGRPSDVRRLMRSFGVVAAKNASGIPELHSSFVYVLDRHVRLARTLLLSTGLSKDVEEVLHEPAVRD